MAARDHLVQEVGSLRAFFALDPIKGEFVRRASLGWPRYARNDDRVLQESVGEWWFSRHALRCAEWQGRQLGGRHDSVPSRLDGRRQDIGGYLMSVPSAGGQKC